MLKNSYVGRIFENSTNGVKKDDGFWEVIVTITEKLSVDGKEWKTEKVEAMGVDRSFDAAHRTALQSVLLWMEEHVYSKGFESLIEAVETANASNDNKSTQA